MNRRAWRLWAAVALAAVLSAPPAMGQGASERPAPSLAPRRFDIPAQPLDTAIEAFAAQTGLQVLYDRPVALQTRSPGVHETATPPAALERLIEGSSLVARFSDPWNVTLEPAQAAGGGGQSGAAVRGAAQLTLDPLRVQGVVVTDEPARADGAAAVFYVALVRSEVRRALAQDRRTAKGAYIATVQIWIDALGCITRAWVESLSGAAPPAATIAEVLKTVVLEAPPPARLPQPLRLVVHARKP